MYRDGDGNEICLSDLECSCCSYFDELNSFCWVRWVERYSWDAGCELHSDLEYMEKVECEH